MIKVSQKNRDEIYKMLEAGHYIALATEDLVETAKRSQKKSGVKYTWVLYDRIRRVRGAG